MDNEFKPVVPLCVANWYEEHKENFEWSLSHICLDIMNGVFNDNKEMYNWFSDMSNKPIETLVKMKLFDFTVEEFEQRYTAKLVRTGEYLYHDVKYRQLYHTTLSDEMARETDGCIFTKDELVWAYAWDNKAYDVEDVKE